MTNDRDTLPIGPDPRGIRTMYGFALLVLYLLPYAAQSQSIQCMSAVQQLQWYAQQVQAVYNQKGMPIRYGCMQQCGGGNMWCQQQCEATYTAPLNQWYNMQAQQVNYWANNIAASCLDDPSDMDFDDDLDTGGIEGKLDDLKRKVGREGRKRKLDIDIPDDVDFR